jgi:DNA-binding MarR family transcriptional regulator
MGPHKVFAGHIFRIINKLIFLEKKSMLEFEGVKLYPSELHLIDVINEDQTKNAMAMAKKLGVSKGAVSQTLTRLEKKNILIKIKDPFKKNELNVKFTPFGQKAVSHHHNRRAALQNEYERYLATISDKDKDLILNFLKHVEGFIDRLG